MNTKKNQIIFVHGLILVFILLSITLPAVCQRDFSTSEITKLVVLGWIFIEFFRFNYPMCYELYTGIDTKPADQHKS
jgi:hypothetical protein